MDINFHYFAVKTIAMFAGFDENEAQIIAAYSQLVDDYNDMATCFVAEASDRWVQNGIINSNPLGYTFSPITTGFNRLFDMINLARPSKQLHISVPFHFIPTTKVTRALYNLETGRERLATYAIDYNGRNNNQPIFKLLKTAREKYGQDMTNVENLIRIGAILHVFADTFAHNGFSGFHGYENFGYVTKCVNAKDPSKDYTLRQQYNTYNVICAQIPAIGHAEVNHAPDMSYAQFSWKKALNNSEKDTTSYSMEYSRNNALEFIRASESIFRFLIHCRAQDAYNNDTVIMPDSLRDILYNGFMIEYNDETPEMGMLIQKWNEIFSSGNYNYSKETYVSNQMHLQISDEDLVYIPIDKYGVGEAIISGTKFATALLYKNIDDDLLAFNMIAREIKEAVVDTTLLEEMEDSCDNEI